jgi:hypothetical protein
MPRTLSHSASEPNLVRLTGPEHLASDDARLGDIEQGNSRGLALLPGGEQAGALIPFKKRLNAAAPLPHQYKCKSHHTGAIVFSATCATFAGVLYIVGGKERGNEYIAGGFIVNFTQNILYGVGTYFFFANSFSKKQWKSLAAASIPALLSSVPSTIATYNFCTDEYTKYVFELTSIQFIGNLPSAIYGCSAATVRSVNYWRDRPALRQLLLQELHANEAGNALLVGLFIEERTKLTTTIGYIAGGSICIFLDGSQTGYYCGAERFLTYTANIPYILSGILSLFANAPTLIIAYFCYELGVDAVNLVVDAIRWCMGDKTLNRSARDWYFDLMAVVCIAGTIFPALRSSATSEKLYEDCPNLGPFHDPLKHNSSEGAMAFNFAMSSKAIHAIFNYLKIAYSRADDKLRYEFLAQQEFLRSGSINEVGKFAKAVHPLDQGIVERYPTNSQVLRTKVSTFFHCGKKPSNESRRNQPRVSMCDTIMSFFGCGKKKQAEAYAELSSGHDSRGRSPRTQALVELALAEEIAVPSPPPAATSTTSTSALASALARVAVPTSPSVASTTTASTSRLLSPSYHQRG